CALAGAVGPSERAALARGLAAAGVARSVRVISDAEAALHDAFGATGAGILLIAGTGSIALARRADRTLVRVGGWGMLLGDEGSGYAIGLAAARIVARAHDGRAEATALTPVVLDHAGVRTPLDLIAWSARATKRHIAALAPAVLALASRDAAAMRIQQDAVAALIELVASAARRSAGQGEAALDVALAGSLLAPGGPLRDPVGQALAAPPLELRLEDRAVDAARGAARLASEGQ
ncbi:MAG: N-acetylglucosamine kinase, partial [Longimicrobiales bacterium]